ncbi:hypothetical protein WMY93_030143 [Mugilogobius chulae]|uniref:SMC hinge domain-containing protein n=1 Tax=Mugilogobius chulae TaxID=88201 RepID=A0AAW0MXU8_9GOBI
MQFERRRNLCIYDRRFEDSKRKEEWLVTSGLDFEGFLRILSETFSVPDHEKFLLVTTERTVLDAEIFSKLDDRATLYMLQREDQALEVPAEELIYFTPHHDTVVESGTFKYYDSEGKKSLPNALADLVDNSLSATVNNSGMRRIEIRAVAFDESYCKPAVIVWDNGCGMTSKQLNNWAVYKLSKFKRENGSGQGSYARPGHVCRSLNSDISYFGVGGKQAAFYIGTTTRVITKSSCSPDVHELILSKTLFEKNEKNKEDTYSTHIFNRKPCESSHITKAEDRFLSDLIAEESNLQSFTAVVITDVRQEHIAFLKEDFNVWTRQLAHIYHYYIHGVNGNIKEAEPISSETDFEVSKIDIIITLKTKSLKSPFVLNLRDIDTDMQSMYIKAAVSTFEFKACTNPEAGIVEGILRYHPFLYDQETYPEDPDAVNECVEEDDEDDYNHDSHPKKRKKPIFECYWNGRLIPYTTVQDFDWCSLPHKGSKEVPAECYNRISGVLFTDDTFKVTENKLTFIDLEQLLKNKNTIFTVVMKGQKQRTNIQRDFYQWLKHCNEKYDKQIKFMHYQGTITRTDIPTKRNQYPWATFSSMEWGGKEYKTGDYVKSLKTVPIYNGKLNHFLLFGTHDCDIYGSGGLVEISLEPEGLYEKTKVIPISKLDRSASVEEIKRNIRSDYAKLPNKLLVHWPNGNPWVDNTTCPAGTPLGPIQIQIVNQKGETMSKLPTIGKGPGKKLSILLTLVQHAPGGDQEVVNLEAPHSASWDFWFKEIENIVTLGKYTLHLFAIHTETKSKRIGEKNLPHVKLRFTIKEDVADHFDVAKLDSTHQRIGIPFDITLELQDKHGHTVEPSPDLKPTLHCSDLNVVHGQVKCTVNTLTIKNVKVTGKLKSLQSNPCDLTVTLDGLREPSKTLTISLLPGNAHAIHVIPKDEPIKVENGETVKFTVMIQDEAGNITTTPKLTTRCMITNHQPANINCMTGVGEHVTKPIKVSLTSGKQQTIQAVFSVINRSGIKEVTRKLLVIPSKRVNSIKIYKKDVDLELKNSEKINWMAGAVLEDLYFKLYDEGNREVPITEEVASKIKVNWVAQMNIKELMDSKLPRVNVPTKVDDHQFYQVSYQAQSVSFSFTIVPIPDVPAGLKATLPKSTLKLGENLNERIVLELVDRFENVTKTMTQSCLNEITVEGEGLNKHSLAFNFEKRSCSVQVSGVCFSSGTPGPREIMFTVGKFTCNVRLNVAAGNPAKLVLISGQPQHINILNGHGISTPFVIQLCDLWGNPSIDKRVVVKISASSELQMQPNFSSQPVNAEGQASFTVICVSGPKNLPERPNTWPSINLTVLPDPNKPASLDVQYEKTASFVAGESFPEFAVRVMSDEGSPMISRQAVSMLYWKGEQSRQTPLNTPFEFQCCEPTENDKKDTFYFREKPIPEIVGKYTIQFCLRDTKDKIILYSNHIYVNVVANRPVKLAPENPPQTQVVSYSEDISKRILVDNMTLFVMDRFENPAGQGLNGEVEICIENLNRQRKEELPLFEDKTNNCKIKLENGRAHIANLAIMKNSPGKDGATYVVVFKPVFSSRISGNMDSYKFRFGFSKDEVNQKEHVELSRQRENIQKDIVQIKSVQDLQLNAIQELKSRTKLFVLSKSCVRAVLNVSHCVIYIFFIPDLAQRSCEKEAALRTQLKNDWNINLPENASIEAIDRILKSKLLEADNVWYKRKRICKIPNDHSGQDILGRVCHLALVEDDAAAWAISWQMKGDMKCVITTTTTAAKQIYDYTKGMQEVLPIDTISAACRRPFLPLPHILRDGRALFNPLGNPVYAIDVLIFPKCQEECLIVFRNLLGNTILIDDLNAANLYRQEVVKHNMTYKLVMFAAPLLEPHRTTYGNLQRNIELLNLYKVELEKKVKYCHNQMQELREYNAEIKKSRESLSCLEKQLEEIETKLATPQRQMKRLSSSYGESSGIFSKRVKLS